MSDKPYCPWCGRNMDELENGKIDGHVWYRDDSYYIQNIERSRDFMKGRIEQLEQLCRDLYKCACMSDNCSYCETQNDCALSRAKKLGGLRDCHEHSNRTS